jgi:hypothetical protein
MLLLVQFNGRCATGELPGRVLEMRYVVVAGIIRPGAIKPEMLVAAGALAWLVT